MLYASLVSLENPLKARPRSERCASYE